LTQSLIPTDTACNNTEPCAENEYAKVTGDVTINYALEAIARMAPEYTNLSNAFLQGRAEK
jgi:hypothetical protein